MTDSKKVRSKVIKDEILKTLEKRFINHMNRHTGIDWKKILVRLENNPEKTESLMKMEETGGEPDVVGLDKKTGEYLFMDCSAETPKGRTSLCYDERALKSRKEHKPKGSALGMAEEIGIEILTEEEYRGLQKLGDFDLKTSSWVRTPEEIRKLGGALFCDRRYGHVFVYHNGAESYYGVRGFRGSLRV